MPTRDAMIESLTAWIKADEAKRRAEIVSIATILGMPSGRPWRDIPDAEVARLHRAVFAADFRTDEEFDKSLPF